MNNKQFSTFTVLPFVAFLLFAGNVRAQNESASEPPWTTMSAGQTFYGIWYAKDGKVWNGRNFVVSCPSNIAELVISPPSPLKKLVALCHSTNGDLDKAYVVDTSRNRMTRLRLIGNGPAWINWSPEERFALRDWRRRWPRTSLLGRSTVEREQGD